MAGDPLYPECRPRCVRQMAVGDGHILHVEECGPVDGWPVLFLHDGPGDGCQPEHRRLFDPLRFRVILIDQRGAGHSLPSGALAANTTLDLVGDLEYVREALGIQHWIVFGTGWGSLLALVYSQLFVERVDGLVLCGIFLGSRGEVDAALQKPYPDAVSALPVKGPLNQTPDEFKQVKARLREHYLRQACFIAPGQLLSGVDSLRHLPAAIVHGMADPFLPASSAETLHHAWPEATWFPVANTGCELLVPPLAKACIRALDWVAESVASVAL